MTSLTTTSVRVAVRQRLINLFAAHPALTGLDVRYGSPPEGYSYASLWIGDIVGEYELANMKAGRKSRNDRFALTVWVIAVAADNDGQAADVRCEELFAAVEDVIADDPTLGTVAPAPFSAIVSGPSHGPNARQIDGGWASDRSCTVTCYARLT